MTHLTLELLNELSNSFVCTSHLNLHVNVMLPSHGPPLVISSTVHCARNTKYGCIYVMCCQDDKRRHTILDYSIVPMLQRRPLLLQLPLAVLYRLRINSSCGTCRTRISSIYQICHQQLPYTRAVCTHRPLKTRNH